MNLDDKFEFGKYKGLTLTEVFIGTQAIDRELLQHYVEEKIANDIAFTTHEFLLEMMGFEVGRTLLRAMPELDELNGDWSQTLEEVLRDGSSQIDRVIGRITLDDCNTKWYATTKGKPSVAGGNPSYIEWCVLNVEGFCLDEHVVTFFAETQYCFFEGVKLVHKIEDIYKYEPKIQMLHWKFRSEVLEKNRETLAKATAQSNRTRSTREDFFFEEDSFGNEYEKYNGYNGWSDDAIDTAFEGDPEATWNVD